jgi:hypothetical protein
MTTATPAPAPAPTHALNLTAQTRLGLYLVSALGSIIVAYGSAKGWAWLGEPEIGAWSSLVALVNGLAAMNVRSK